MPRKTVAQKQAAAEQAAAEAGLFVPNHEIKDYSPGVTKPGLYMANAALEESHYQEAITQYVTSWLDENNIQEDLDAVAPPVPAARRFEFAKMENADAFLSESDDIRSIGSDFKRVQWAAAMQTDKTLNKGLTLIIDKDNLPPGDDGEELLAAFLMARVLRNDLRRGWNLLSGIHAGTAKTWDTSAGKDPDADVVQEIEVSADASGIMPNVVFYGPTAWTKRFLSHRAQQTAGGFSSSGLTKEQLAGLFNVDRVVVIRERFQTTRGAATKTLVAGAQVIMANQSASPLPDDPSNVKRFVSPVDQGGNLGVYLDDTKLKTIEITVEHYSKIISPTGLGVRRFNIS